MLRDTTGKRGGLGLLYCIVMLAVSAAGFAQSKDPASAAPPEAIFFAGIADWDQFVEAYKRTSGYQMLSDPALKALEQGDKPRSLEKVTERLATVLGLSPDDLKPPFKGSIVAYVTAPRGGTVEQIDGALIAGIGDVDRAQKIYSAITKKCKERSDSYEAVSVGSNSIDVYTRAARPEDEDNADHAPATDELEELVTFSPEQAIAELLNTFIDEAIEGKMFPEKLAMCLTSDRFIIGPSADAVRAALRQPQGGESLADNDDYKAFLRKHSNFGHVRLLLSIPRIIELTAGSDEDAKKTVSSLGLEGMRNLVLAGEIGAKDCDSRSEGILFMSGERSGLPRLLSMDNRAIAPPAQIPPKSIFALSLNLNPIKMLDEIERMMRKSSPEEADEMRRALENAPGPDGETMNVRKDIIENLREPLTLSFGFARPLTPESARALIAIGHRNAETIQKLFEKMMPAAPRDMREAQVYDFPMFGVSVAVTADHICAGLTPSVESAIHSGERETLAGDANFKRFAKFLPEEAWALVYFDYAQLFDAMIGYGEKRDELKNVQAMNAGAMIMHGLIGMYESMFKNAKPEQVRAIRKYYGTTVFTLSTISEGVRITEVTMNPLSE